MASRSKTSDFQAKIIIIGEAGVGKTSILNRYDDDAYINKYMCNIGADYQLKLIEVNGEKVKLELWDTAGQERFLALHRNYYRCAHGVMLCYAINNRYSFERIGYWMEEAKKDGIQEDACFVIVGTKNDRHDERVVSTDEGRKFAESLGLKFFETSTKQNLHIINEAFLSLAKDMCEVHSKERKEVYESGAQLSFRENNHATQNPCFKCG